MVLFGNGAPLQGCFLFCRRPPTLVAAVKRLNASVNVLGTTATGPFGLDARPGTASFGSLTSTQ